MRFGGAIGGTAEVRVADNTIAGALHGIHHDVSGLIGNDAAVTYAGNMITPTGLDGVGILLNTLDSSRPVTVTGGSITGGAFGLVARQRADAGLNGHLLLDGAVIRGAKDTGLSVSTDGRVGALTVALENGVTIEGGASPDDIGLVIDGPGVSLVDNTLNDTVFAGQNGNYIELRNGALFEPGQPTVVDATGVTFDAFDPAQPADALAIEDRIIHSPDDGTLGLIDFGATPMQTASGSP